MVNRLILILTMGLMLTGFKFGFLEIQVRYDNIAGLKKNDRVVFEQASIGQVDKVLYDDDGIYSASLSINKDFKDVVTRHTRFIIIPDPGFEGRKAVELVQVHLGGPPLKNGSIVEGTDKYSVFLELMADDVKDGIDYLKREYRQFSNELKTLSEHEKVRELKKLLARLGQALKKESKETREKIATEIIPLIEQEIEALKEQLKAYGREEEVEPLEKELKKIKFI